MKTVAIVILVSMLTACGTVAGIGSDIQKSAEWTRDKMSSTKSDSTK
jgi:predicted small secreted protein